MSCATQCGPASAAQLVEMNETCACMPLDAQALRAGLMPLQARRDAPAKALPPVLFATTPVFACDADIAAMQALIRVVERTIRSPAFAARIEARAQRDGRPADAAPLRSPGAFTGYDFHLDASGPHLIEINTNAGGAFLVQHLYAAATRATALCEGAWAAPADPDWIWQMLVAEWQAHGRAGVPTTLAIVDESPAEQFLSPEFVLARHELARYGERVFIADPAELRYAGGALLLGDQRIDMVCNRLTDFALSEPGARTLRSAWADDAVVLTPSPSHHARFADKRNLVWLSDPADPLRAGLSRADVGWLNLIPRVQAVTPEHADALWAARKQLFFKPAHGFGSRGAYRGSKLTRKTWAAICAADQRQGPYVAQTLVAPATRRVTQPAAGALKYDVRAFTFDGEIQLLAARLYQGQTTNFRSPGGGFAPLVVLRAADIQAQAD